jgi:hypothetical protein
MDRVFARVAGGGERATPVVALCGWRVANNGDITSPSSQPLCKLTSVNDLSF